MSELSTVVIVVIVLKAEHFFYIFLESWTPFCRLAIVLSTRLIYMTIRQMIFRFYTSTIPLKGLIDKIKLHYILRTHCSSVLFLQFKTGMWKDTMDRERKRQRHLERETKTDRDRKRQTQTDIDRQTELYKKTRNTEKEHFVVVVLSFPSISFFLCCFVVDAVVVVVCVVVVVDVLLLLLFCLFVCLCFQRFWLFMPNSKPT